MRFRSVCLREDDWRMPFGVESKRGGTDWFAQSPSNEQKVDFFPKGPRGHPVKTSHAGCCLVRKHISSPKSESVKIQAAKLISFHLPLRRAETTPRGLPRNLEANRGKPKGQAVSEMPKSSIRLASSICPTKVQFGVHA